MKTKITLLIFVFLPMFLFAQKKDDYRKYTRFHFKHIEWNGKQFDNSLKGIRLIMEDMETVDPILHKILKTDLRLYKKRKRIGAVIVGAGIITSTGLMMGGVSEALSHGDGTTADKNKVNVYFMSSMITLIATIGGAKVVAGPSSRKFIYSFTQKIKSSAQGTKIKYTIRPDVQLGNNSSIGVSFSLIF